MNRVLDCARALLPALFLALPLAGQVAMPGAYRLPPDPIPQILDAPPTPAITRSPGGSTLAILGRTGMLSLADLAEPELRLAGSRISPVTNGPSRVTYQNSILLQEIGSGVRREVRLPAGARVSSVQWSPDGTRLAFANTVENGIELWVLEVGAAEPRRLLGPELNATLGAPFVWAPDGRSLIVRRVPPSRGLPPERPRVPAGPIIQENSGPAAPVRTYQDLLTNPHDEALFEYYFTSQLARVALDGSPPTPIGEPGIFSGLSVAPGGEYLLLTRVRRPFSYVLPLGSFANETFVADLAGNPVYTLNTRREVTPPPIGRDMVLDAPRGVHWRADAPATLVWAIPMDRGDARRASEVRDRVVMLEAPFRGEPRILVDLDQRFAGIVWGRNDVALVQSSWSTDARTRTRIIDPSRPGSEGRVLWDRSSEAAYDHPGSPLTTPTGTGYSVLRFAPDGRHIYLAGEGASPRGSYPFLDRLNLSTGQAERLWQAADPHYEVLVDLLDAEGTRILTRRESVDEPPNYYVRDLSSGAVTAITSFPDPAPQLAGIQRQLITYAREDGVQLSATLFTPPGYEPARDGPLPVLVWAYPREFRDADAAGQVAGSPNRFSRPGGDSHLFLLTQGYAILDGPAMPIIGEGDEEPNDRYIEQLVASARAAVDHVVELGVADRNRIGVGGHSYGAFMTANLLAHSDLFRAGIARSGAYNRSLTPFGFQAEPRSYWEAPEVYHAMSPFNYAHRIQEPILLIHGELDNNSGTFPIQSERMYQALQGHGATVRYVVLPYESHGYAGRESVLHTLAEMIDWMDRHVKYGGADR